MQWTLIVCITNAVCSVPGAWAQYGVPVPVYAVPPPVMPVLVPALVVQQGGAPATTTTTTTTTTPRSVAVAVPVPVPVPVGVPYAVNAMPAFPPAACQARARPPNCPPCPPCVCLPTCTPAFFSYCSPCHQRCRCRDPAEAPPPPPPPMPVAMPMPAPPPLVVMPFQPSIRLPKLKKTKVKKRDPCASSSDTSGDTTTDESSSYESLGSSDLDIYYKKARKRRKRRKRIFARRKDGRSSDSEVVKPVLTYVSENGDVKFKKKISNADATWLLDKEKNNKDKEQVETVHWLPDAEGVALARSMKQIVVKNDKTKGTLRQDKKKIVFRPPANKKISNLTVSFQVAE